MCIHVIINNQCCHSTTECGQHYINIIKYIQDPAHCYVRQCLLVLKFALDFFKCLGFQMHFISLYGALSLHNCSSSGSLVFACLGRINYDCTSSNISTDSYIIYRDIYSIYYSCKLQDLIKIHNFYLSVSYRELVLPLSPWSGRALHGPLLVPSFSALSCVFCIFSLCVFF